MDNNDNLKEIATNLRKDLAGTIYTPGGIKKIESALSEAYNLGISVSVKEYAVEVLRELKAKVDEYLANAETYFMAQEGCEASMALIESTITELKSNPSGNIGIDKWIPVSERLPEEGQPCLVVVLGRETPKFCCYERGEFYRLTETIFGDRLTNFYYHNVKLWQPLPALPPSPYSK